MGQLRQVGPFVRMSESSAEQPLTYQRDKVEPLRRTRTCLRVLRSLLDAFCVAHLESRYSFCLFRTISRQTIHTHFAYNLAGRSVRRLPIRPRLNFETTDAIR